MPNSALPLALPSFQLSSPFVGRLREHRITKTIPRRFRICFSPSSSSSFPIPSPLKWPTNNDPAEEDILRYVADASERTTPTLPCARTFENDSARFSLVGSASFDQAITASAADGGQSAAEHLRSNVPCMVIETVFPLPSHHHATVSTRLFVPAERVLEKGEKLKQRFPGEMLSSAYLRNILSTTFRQVVMRKLWSFELTLFPAGTVRNMDDLDTPRKLEESFVIRSSDDHTITMLAEVVCAASLRNTGREFPINTFNFKKRKRITSVDSSVTIEESEENRIPMYRIVVNGDKNMKFDGWKKIADDKFEIALTHKEMVGLSDVLDMFYEDPYTLPLKESLPVDLCTPMAYPWRKGILLMKFLAVGSIFACLSFVCFLRLPKFLKSSEGFYKTAYEVEEASTRESVTDL